MSFEDYLLAIAKRREYYPEWREGQAAFNTLRELNPDLAHEIQFETGLDPFHLYSDTPYAKLKLSAFFEYVKAKWENNE